MIRQRYRKPNFDWKGECLRLREEVEVLNKKVDKQKTLINILKDLIKDLVN